MASLMPISTALERILSDVHRLEAETVPLMDALEAVLAQELTSPLNLPPFDNSAMDGYAVRAEDTTFAPVTLRVVDDIPAGRMSDRTLSTGQVARIMTGAPIPLGADAIVPVELTLTNWGGMPGAGTSGTVTINEAVRTGDSVRFAGENVREGQALLPAGHVIRPQDIGIMASVGLSHVEVIRQPLVAILTSGDELASYDTPLEPGQIYDGNSPMLAALMLQYGAKPVIIPAARDSLASVRASFQAALDLRPDLIVSSAGVSVGAADFVRPVLAELGQVDFWRINLRPGRPLAYGKLGDIPFFGLPGNPVSAMVTAELVVKPTIYAMLGRRDDSLTISAVTGEAFKSDGRRSYLRCKVNYEGGRAVATLTGTQSSGALYSLVEADGLMIIPEDVIDVAEGTPVEVRLLK